jgi:hypothetical protein
MRGGATAFAGGVSVVAALAVATITLACPAPHIAPAVRFFGSFYAGGLDVTDGRYVLLRLRPNVYRTYDTKTRSQGAQFDMAKLSRGKICAPWKAHKGVLLIRCQAKNGELSFDHWIVRLRNGALTRVPASPDERFPSERHAYGIAGRYWLMGAYYDSELNAGAYMYYINWHTGEYRADLSWPRNLDSPDLRPLLARQPQFSVSRSGRLSGRKGNVLYLHERRRRGTLNVRLGVCGDRCEFRIDLTAGVVTWERPIDQPRRTWHANAYLLRERRRLTWTVKVPAGIAAPNVVQRPTRFANYLRVTAAPRHGHAFEHTYEARWARETPAVPARGIPRRGI